MRPAYGRARNRFGLRLGAVAAAGVILVAAAFAYARADSSGEQGGSASIVLQRLQARGCRNRCGARRGGPTSLPATARNGILGRSRGPSGRSRRHLIDCHRVSGCSCEEGGTARTWTSHGVRDGESADHAPQLSRRTAGPAAGRRRSLQRRPGALGCRLCPVHGLTMQGANGCDNNTNVYVGGRSGASRSPETKSETGTITGSSPTPERRTCR